MNRGLKDIDTDAVQEAVELLREGGFAVDEIAYVERDEQGVEFDLTLYKPTRCKPLDGDEEGDA